VIKNKEKNKAVEGQEAVQWRIKIQQKEQKKRND
jgi:hypothetical protein